MNSRKKGTGSEVNITLTMSNCYTAAPYVQILGWYSFLLHFDTDNCLLKKFHYTYKLVFPALFCNYGCISNDAYALLGIHIVCAMTDVF
jgi:hypothetical protein